MSLDNTQVVDALGTDRESGFAVLTIIDHWDWSEEKEHLIALQTKLNFYFEFVESGQIFTSYPEAVDRKLCIDIVSRFPISGAGQTLLRRAAEAASQLNIAITNRVHS